MIKLYNIKNRSDFNIFNAANGVKILNGNSNFFVVMNENKKIIARFTRSEDTAIVSKLIQEKGGSIFNKILNVYKGVDKNYENFYVIIEEEVNLLSDVEKQKIYKDLLDKTFVRGQRNFVNNFRSEFINDNKTKIVEFLYYLYQNGVDIKDKYQRQINKIFTKLDELGVEGFSLNDKKLGKEKNNLILFSINGISTKQNIKGIEDIDIPRNINFTDDINYSKLIPLANWVFDKH